VDSYTRSSPDPLFAIRGPVFCHQKTAPQPVNINTADSIPLQLVPGIGPSTAEKILQMRKSYGSFKSVNELTAIRGIDPKRLEKMRKYLTVGKVSAALNTAQPANCPGFLKPKLHALTNSTPTKSAPTKFAVTQKVLPPRQPSSEQPAPETEEP
jgi:competence ComEA-like helix-hairpin-helix protein